MSKVEVIFFEKKCAHGFTMHLVRKLNNGNPLQWYEPSEDCSVCQAQVAAEKAEQQAKFDAFIKRLSERKRK